jgi:serine protease
MTHSLHHLTRPTLFAMLIASACRAMAVRRVELTSPNARDFLPGLKPKKMIKPTTMFVALMSCFAAAQAVEIKGVGSPNAIPYRYIVVFKDQATISATGAKISAATIASQMGYRYGAAVQRTYEHAIKGAAVTMDLVQAQAMAQDPSVAYVEQDQRVSVAATQSNATWGIDRIDQPNLPLSKTYTYPASTGVHAYVIDTGLRGTHTEFTDRVGAGFDAVKDGKGTNDCHGHGTHVAGTVGGKTWGVAKDVIIHPVRVLDCEGSGSYTGIIAGMDWVVKNRVKPAVANMSLGGGASQAIDDAIARMTSSGVVTVVAAGNEASNACNVSPARAPSAITVGSTTNTDAMSDFSNYGTCVDVYAPGSAITSAAGLSDTGSTTMSGTSMASPHVAGIAALYLSKNPSATVSQVTSAILTNSLTGKITGIPSGLNKFVNTQFLSGPTGDTTITLTSGTPVSVSLALGASKTYKIVVPAGKTTVGFKLYGGTGNGNLYAKMGSAPTTTSYTQKSDGTTNEEVIRFSAPVAGTYYLLVNAAAAVSSASVGAVILDY